MKKFLLAAAITAMFAACTTDATKDVAIALPDTIEVSFEEDSRIELSDNKTVWTTDDMVSVFYKSDANQMWKFNGQTGDRNGSLSRVDSGHSSVATEKVVVVYPYNPDYNFIASNCNIEAILADRQHYQLDSYGRGSSIMVSAGNYNQFSLKNVCGWLKLQLTGNGEVVNRVVLRGNNNEQLAGGIYINTATAASVLSSESAEFIAGYPDSSLHYDHIVINEVTLNCDDNVTLSQEPTSFYITLPPMKFESGFTVEVVCNNGKQMVKSTTTELSIARNTISPMAVIPFESDSTIPNNEIHYTSTDGKVVTPNKTDRFGANIVSNTYENGQGIITFDGNVTKIGSYAFQYRSSLTSITIPNSATEIGGSAFDGCSGLTSITIPESVTKISNYAFRNCLSLTSIAIPESVTSIGDYAFDYCSSLASITIPNSVTVIGVAAFEYCNNLSEFNGKFASEDKRCLIVDGTLISFAPAGLQEYSIPNGVTLFGDYALCGCLNMTSITIPEGVTAIGNSAFESCCSLTSITIPESVTSIGEWAFVWCSSLTSITIPNGVTEICCAAFAECSNLSEFNGKLASEDKRCLIVNGTLTSFAPAGLTEYSIPSSVTSIGDYAFADCSSLTNVTIPDSVTSIGKSAFNGCSSLTSVTIPDSVTKIDDYAFVYCFELAEVFCKSTTPPTLGGSHVFDDNATGRKIHVPAASVDAYKTAAYWSEYADAIVAWEQAKQYNIGDIVTFNGAKGVVFQVSPSVKIVSVEECLQPIWGVDGVATGATDAEDGRNNLATICAIDNWEQNYLAFKWCANMGEGWYLPAYKELQAVYSQKDALNEVLTANNFAALGAASRYYWSSTEYSNLYAYDVWFTDGSDDIFMKSYATAPFYVRAIAVLE